MFSVARIVLPLSLSVLAIIYEYFRSRRISELPEGVDPEILDWIRTLNPAELNSIRNRDPAFLDVIRNLDSAAFPSEFSGSVDGPLNPPSVPSPAPAVLDGGSSENRSGSNFTLAAFSAAQSQASASKRLNGDLSKAEDCYTKGVKCVSRNETSRSCLRALMLCYSDREATRLTVGRIRDALGDCMTADDGAVLARLAAPTWRSSMKKVGESQQSAASPVAGAGFAAFLAWRW